MDESDSKIKIDSFFGRVDSIDKVANSALSKSKGNFDTEDEAESLVDKTFNVVADCIDTVFTEEDAWDAKDYTPDERIDFVNQLNSKQYKAVEKFFATMPKLSHKIEVVNPNTKEKSSIVLEGLSDFFV